MTKERQIEIVKWWINNPVSLLCGKGLPVPPIGSADCDNGCPLKNICVNHERKYVIEFAKQWLKENGDGSIFIKHTTIRKY